MVKKEFVKSTSGQCLKKTSIFFLVSHPLKINLWEKPLPLLNIIVFNPIQYNRVPFSYCDSYILPICVISTQFAFHNSAENNIHCNPENQANLYLVKLILILPIDVNVVIKEKT
jgi:hypothetical protein